MYEHGRAAIDGVIAHDSGVALRLVPAGVEGIIGFGHGPDGAPGRHLVRFWLAQLGRTTPPEQHVLVEPVACDGTDPLEWFYDCGSRPLALGELYEGIEYAMQATATG